MSTPGAKVFPQTHAEKQADKAKRRMQFTLHHGGPHERMFLQAYDEVFGQLGHRAAGEYIRQCVLIGAAFMQPQALDIQDLMKKLGRTSANVTSQEPNSDPASESAERNNIQTNENGLSSYNHSESADDGGRADIAGLEEASAQGPHEDPRPTTGARLLNMMGRGQRTTEQAPE